MTEVVITAEKKMNIVFESTVKEITDVNSSFAKGVLMVAYHGKNRNGTIISKETFEACIGTIYNCPIVCNYDRQSDSIGSHDVAIVKTGKGYKKINLTQPVGLIPESAEWWWEEVAEGEGVTHEYLCVDALLWKRQEAYEKIKENKVTDESMEITILSRHKDGDYYVIDSFEFTAFCLLEGAEPCFESAQLEVFAADDFRKEYSQMLEDFKASFAKVSDGHNINEYLKGGTKQLENEKQKTSVETQTEETSVKQPVAQENENFSLTSEQFIQEVCHQLENVKTYDDLFREEVSKYRYLDYDSSLSEVYVMSREDWLTYGIQYTLDGDKVVLDFASVKRKKIVYVDFEDGDSSNFSLEEFAKYFAEAGMKKGAAEAESQWSEKYSGAEQTIQNIEKELTSLREFQAEKVAQERKDAEQKVFSSFGDLNGVEEFEALRKGCGEMSIEDIEQKCFALRGRRVRVDTQSKSTESIRIPAGSEKSEPEPYGGLFARYKSGNC